MLNNGRDIRDRAWKENIYQEIFVGADALLMWGNLESISTTPILSLGSLAAMFEASAFTINTVQSINTKKLVMEHLWNAQGNNIAQ